MAGVETTFWMYIWPSANREHFISTDLMFEHFRFYILNLFFFFQTKVGDTKGDKLKIEETSVSGHE